jgi:hypothetical protein
MVMDTTEIGVLIGQISIDLIWVALVVFTGYRAVKERRWGWSLVLAVNVMVGLAYPIIVSMVLPVVFLAMNRSPSQKRVPG